ncbi:MAG: VanZ family protein [Armatimonadota bacterium]
MCVCKGAKQAIYWLPGIAYIAGIFYLSSQSSFDAVSYIRISDKLVHFILYAGLSAALFIGAYKAPFTMFINPYWLVFLLAIFYGVSDEFHQSFVADRSVEFMDWLADTVGAAFGLSVIALISKIKSSRSKFQHPTSNF